MSIQNADYRVYLLKPMKLVSDRKSRGGPVGEEVKDYVLKNQWTQLVRMSLDRKRVECTSGKYNNRVSSSSDDSGSSCSDDSKSSSIKHKRRLRSDTPAQYGKIKLSPEEDRLNFEQIVRECGGKGVTREEFRIMREKRPRDLKSIRSTGKSLDPYGRDDDNEHIDSRPQDNPPLFGKQRLLERVDRPEQDDHSEQDDRSEQDDHSEQDDRERKKQRRKACINDGDVFLFEFKA